MSISGLHTHVHAFLQKMKNFYFILKFIQKYIQIYIFEAGSLYIDLAGLEMTM